MIWNPLKKKQDKDGEEQPAPAAAPISEPAMDTDDRTDPLIGAGQLEERVDLLSATDAEVELERVELWGPDGITDRFLRVGVKQDNPHALAIRNTLLNLPERTTGFRDLLFSDSHALRAKLDSPEHRLDELPRLLESGSVYIRPADLVQGMREVWVLLDLACEHFAVTPAELTARHIGLTREPHDAGGHAGWRFTFCGWDSLVTDSQEDVMQPVGRIFSAAVGQLANHCRGASLTQFADELDSLAASILKLNEDDPALPYHPVNARTHGATDVGQRREHNEDAYMCEQLDLHSANGARLTLAAVADGMGGHASGEVASSLSLALLRQQLSMALLAPSTRPVDVAQLAPQLEATIPAIDRALTERAAMDAALAGMGTTLVGYCALEQQSSIERQEERSAAVFWIGDSRAYLLGPCGMRPLSRDHSYVQELVTSGSITAEEARSHQMKNVITRCLGGSGNVGTPEVEPFIPGPGEAILLCSDGLTDAIDDAQIWQVVRDNAVAGWDRVIAALIDAANAAGGPDNITVVVVEFAART